MATMLTWLYRSLIRPVLFTIDAEEAHDLALRLIGPAVPMLNVARTAVFSDQVLAALPRLKTRLAGTDLANPIGVAAGVDKNARLVEVMQHFGFAYAEIGSVTAGPSSGNARPRLFRLPADHAVINRMGLNGDGATVIAARLAASHPGLPVALNIAKSNLPGLHGEKAVQDFLATFKKFEQSKLSYVTVNTSCPNTHDGALAEISELRQILVAIDRVNSRDFPLFLKLSPDSTEQFIDLIFATIAELDFPIAGFVCGNTTTSRLNLQSDGARVAAIGNGGLSGQPLKNRMLAQVSNLYQKKSASQQIIACGGISSTADVVAAIASGATAVQIYTGLVYQGPCLVLEILAQLALTLAQVDSTVDQLVGNEVLAKKILALL